MKIKNFRAILLTAIFSQKNRSAFQNSTLQNSNQQLTPQKKFSAYAEFTELLHCYTIHQLTSQKKISAYAEITELLHC